MRVLATLRGPGAFGLAAMAVPENVFLSTSNGPGQSDLRRAVSKPRNQFRGDGCEGMKAVLDKRLLSSGKSMLACENVTLTELHSVR